MTSPAVSGRHSATPLRTAATSEWVVPRSMPTAWRRACGSGDAPGSEICSSAIGSVLGRDAAIAIELAGERLNLVGRSGVVERLAPRHLALQKLDRHGGVVLGADRSTA